MPSGSAEDLPPDLSCVGEPKILKNRPPASYLHGFLGHGDFLINTEPSKAVICPAGVGIRLFRIKIIGRGGHASMKWKGLSSQSKRKDDLPGVNPIEKMVKFVAAIERLETTWIWARSTD